MSDSALNATSPGNIDAAKAGPAIAPEIHEVYGMFATDAAMQDAVARLTQAGFDRADLSLPAVGNDAATATPEQGASNPNTDTDMRQVRTMGASMAGTAAAFAAAGLTIATGGVAALAIGAAVVAGGGAAALVETLGGAASDAQHSARDEAAAHGELVLSVRTINAERVERATSLMQAAGAAKVAAATRERSA